MLFIFIMNDDPNIFLGKGVLIKSICAPSNKSDKVKKNWKEPCIFLLDNEDKNPFGCTDLYKRVGALFCYGCPSMNGMIGCCSHLGWDRYVGDMIIVCNILSRF